LLWFDLLNGAAGKEPMGSITSAGQPPRFRVSAAGAFKQQPGCSAHVGDALGLQRQASLCANECFNPASERQPLSRIEVVRIRPRQQAGESAAELIEDPWRTFPCATDTDTCSVEFEDPEFVQQGREMIYYVRAIQQATPAVNAANLRCEYDEEGVCIAVNPCYGDARTDWDDDCQSPNEERAWSSPIYIDYRAGLQ
jgi:hypothetical protein